MIVRADTAIPTIPPCAHPFVVHRGTPYARRPGFLEPDEDPTCLIGHPIRGRKIYPLEDGGLPCTHRDAERSQQCGAQIYLLVFPGRGKRRRLWLADAEKADMGIFELGGYSVEQILEYFGQRFPNGPARPVR